MCLVRVKTGLCFTQREEEGSEAVLHVSSVPPRFTEHLIVYCITRTRTLHTYIEDHMCSVIINYIHKSIKGTKKRRKQGRKKTTGNNLVEISLEKDSNILYIHPFCFLIF